MTSMASNYDMDRLVMGTIVATAALIAAVVALVLLPKVGTGSWIPFGLITLLYGIMMFASSYVEEEQHFWYWTTSAWLLSLGIKRYTQAYTSTLFPPSPLLHFPPFPFSFSFSPVIPQELTPKQA